MNKADLNKLVSLRKELHQYPELSGKEKNTSSRIKKFFREFPPDEVVEGMGPNGIAIVFKGEEEGPTTMVRSELDALPIQEEGNIQHISKHAGVSHTCGHDGHMAIACGVGLQLATRRPKKGKVVLLFQPSEETGEGAEQVIASKGFNKILPDYAFALHNLPGFDKNQVVLKKGIFTAASTGMVITLKGKTSHAAHPEDGNSPVEAMCKIMVGLEKLPESFADFSLITIIHAVLGEVAFGTTPGEGKVMATLRSYENETMDKMISYAEKLVHAIAKEYELNVSIDYCEAFQASENDPEAWEFVNNASKALKLKTKHIRTPFRWSEDFGHFSTVTKSMLFGLGAGKRQPQLHESRYDFPDELIPIGVGLFMETIKKINF
jgi:amidohydrolase